MGKISFVIRLGTRWRMFASEREDLTFLGTVQHGMAGIGALARTCDGRYVQVNGDVVAVLNARRIGQALRAQPTKTKESQWAAHPLDGRLVTDLPRRPNRMPVQDNPPPAVASEPVVTVKKRRLAVRATTDASRGSEQTGQALAS